MKKIDTFEFYEPNDRQEWRQWLIDNHSRSDGVWLVYYKKGSGRRNLVYNDAVEEALCFGWIDSLPRKLDSERSALMFTPRKEKSVWSKANKDRIDRLIAEDLMSDAGLKKVNIAKENGSWNSLNRSDGLEMPIELLTALRSNKVAETNFLNFSPSVRKNILAWIFSAKRDETRKRRIAEVVRLAERNMKSGPYAGQKQK